MTRAKVAADKGAIKTSFLGVDPALRKNGFWVCLICRLENTATFKTFRHLGEYARFLNDTRPVAIIVENSNLQRPVFDKEAGVGGAISVGKNMGVSEEATKIAADFSKIPPGISPKDKGAKVKNEMIFQGIVKSNNLSLTGYKAGKTVAQDQRDAFMLALIAEQQYKLHQKVKK